MTKTEKIKSILKNATRPESGLFEEDGSKYLFNILIDKKTDVKLLIVRDIKFYDSFTYFNYSSYKLERYYFYNNNYYYEDEDERKKEDFINLSDIIKEKNEMIHLNFKKLDESYSLEDVRYLILKNCLNTNFLNYEIDQRSALWDYYRPQLLEETTEKKETTKKLYDFSIIDYLTKTADELSAIRWDAITGDSWDYAHYLENLHTKKRKAEFLKEYQATETESKKELTRVFKKLLQNESIKTVKIILKDGSIIQIENKYFIYINILTDDIIKNFKVLKNNGLSTYGRYNPHYNDIQADQILTIEYKNKVLYKAL